MSDQEKPGQKLGQIELVSATKPAANEKPAADQAILPQLPKTAPPPDPAVAWSMRQPLIIGFVALAILVFGFGLWGTLSKIAGAVVASGQVEVEQNRQVVQHPDGGVVAEILVAEGSAVSQGDVLIRLDGTLIAAELSIIEGQLVDNQAQRARFEAERDGKDSITFPEALLSEAAARPELQDQLDGQERLFRARMDGMAKEAEQMVQRKIQIEKQIQGIDAQHEALTTQITLIRKQLVDQEALLKKGLTQASAVLALQREEARLMGQVGELTANRGQAEERITEIEVQLARLDLNRQTEAADGLRRLAPAELELVARRGALRERISRLEIRAPASGVVLGLAVTTPRAVLRSAEPVLYVVPQDRPLVIAARVAPIHIDQVHVGQSAELVLSAFSARTTPHLKGQVTVVSADAFTQEQSGASYYRIEVILNEGELDKLEGQALLPGMPAEVFIQTGARSPLTYLVQPFTDYFNKAFRES